jgi:hypothetical protein
MKYPTMAELATATAVSGLWMSYGDAAEAMGRGQSAARSVGQEAWSYMSGFARADGKTDEAGDQGRRDRWVAENQNAVALGRMLGHEPGTDRPMSLRISAVEALMLLGKVPSTANLRLKVQERLDTLLAAVDTLSGDEPHYEAAWERVDAMRLMLHRLYESEQ